MKTAVVLLLATAALVTAFLVIRWLAYGPGNTTDNDFKPPPWTDSSTTPASTGATGK